MTVVPGKKGQHRKHQRLNGCSELLRRSFSTLLSRLFWPWRVFLPYCHTTMPRKVATFLTACQHSFRNIWYTAHATHMPPLIWSLASSDINPVAFQCIVGKVKEQYSHTNDVQPACEATTYIALEDWVHCAETTWSQNIFRSTPYAISEVK